MDKYNIFTLKTMSKKQIENPVVKVNFSEAKDFADLGAIVQDLGSVMTICLRIEKLMKSNSKDHVLIESYWTTAVIKYSRCFKDSKRFGLDESVLDGLAGDPHGAHKYYLDMRDKHVAHSVNAFEKNCAGLVLTPEDSKEQKVIGVAALSMKHSVADKKGVHQLGVLSKVLLKKVCDIAKQYEDKTLAKGKKLPIRELYKRPRMSLSAPSPDESKTARKS